MDNNLFSLAPKELTGSAFWAWIVNSLDNNKAQERSKLARKFLELCGIHAEGIFAKTEVKCGEQGRADIVVYSPQEKAIAVIENKIFSTSDPTEISKQLKSYKANLGEPVKCIAMTWRYDTEELWADKEIPLISLQKQCEILQNIDDPIVIEYYNYAQKILEERNNGLAFIQDERPLNEIAEKHLLDSHDIQCAFMSKIVSPRYGFKLYNGNNQNGSRWTQASFEIGNYSFFYRIDKAKNGYYFRLNHYTENKKTPAEKSFLQELSKISSLEHPFSWDKDKRLKMDIKYSDAKETTLWCLWLKDIPASLKQFQSWHQTWHEDFKNQANRFL